MNRKCKNSPDSYCYICGSFTLKRCRRQLSPHVMKLYELYFGCKVGDQDKRWAPHVCCVGCSSSLSAWYKGTGSGLTFGVSMIWRRCRRQLSPHVMKLYELYFGCKVGDQDKRWAPHVRCVGCSSSLSAWYKGTGSGLTFGVPMIWRRCRRQLSPHVMKLYELYFGCKVGDQDKRWAPHVRCVGCSSSLSAWYKGTGSGLTFGVPMIWREPLDHSTDCYFCLTDIQDLLTHLYSKEIVIQLLYF